MKRLSIGQRIKKRRLEVGWTQERLAKASGYSRVYILRLEKGYVKSPGLKALSDLSHFLRMDLRDLCK
jgi:transcriptional regulator with XRE-family HTH domain